MRKRSLTTVLAAMLASAAPVHAQTAACESGLVLAQGLSSSGGVSASPAGIQAQASLAQTLSGEESGSTLHQLRTSLPWLEPRIFSSAPIVAGLRPAGGFPKGSNPTRVFGFNFAQPGAGPLDLAFDGVPGSPTVVLSNVQAVTLAPAGIDPAGNPKADVSVIGTNLLGAHTIERGYTYIPALREVSPASVGGSIQMQLSTLPGDTYFLVLGKSVPGFSVPVPPFQGALEILLNLQTIKAYAPTAGGAAYIYIPVPAQAVLAGGTLEFQGFSITDLMGGLASFSNRREVQIQP